MDWTRGHIIGRGSTATVSLATAPHSGNTFAVKSVELSNSQSLQREQQILSSLVSPYIVEYKGNDVTLENNKLNYNLFMEYACGGSLWDVIRDCGGRIDESKIVHFTRQILCGLDYLHGNGIAHCDVKGRNVLVFRGGAAKIGDFGCAKRIDSVDISGDCVANQRREAHFRSDLSAASIGGDNVANQRRRVDSRSDFPVASIGDDYLANQRRGEDFRSDLSAAPISSDNVANQRRQADSRSDSAAPISGGYVANQLRQADFRSDLLAASISGDCVANQRRQSDSRSDFSAASIGGDNVANQLREADFRSDFSAAPIDGDYVANQRRQVDFRSGFSARQIIGTPAFMAPEVVRGEIQSFASDIWSLGCTVIEMATGSPPWRNASGSELISVLYQVGYSSELPEIPKLLSARSRDFLEKCLRRDPEERWSAGDLLNHPWIADFDSIDYLDCAFSSSSPTSILEQGIWNFLEGSGNLENLSRLNDDSVKERMRRLSLISAGARWSNESGGWITIRESNGCDLKEEKRRLFLEGNKRMKVAVNSVFS